MEQYSCSSQIVVFETLHDFRQFVDSAIQQHKSELSRYEDELGLMLRQAGQDGSDATWTKEMENKLGKEKQAKTDEKKDGKEKKNDKKEKRGKERAEGKAKKGTTNWRMYRDIQIYSGIPNQGKTEVYFETVNELKTSVEKLERIRDALAQLVTVGLSNVLYLVSIKSGIPTKLVLLQQTGGESKFEFKADFITENMEVPVEGEV
jgi:hypothetical protein